MDFFYSAERNVQILISLMKAHGIRKVIASPGTTNICFIASIQNDPFFEIYSSPEERSAAYMACGLAEESGEIVALSCTGATASRNYMPGLTEAYYRKLPILVITSSRRSVQIGHNIDQVTDRTLLPRDVAKISVQMPMVYDWESDWGCNIACNKAILELTHRSKGPAHINLETEYSRDYSVKEIKNVRAIYRVTLNDLLPQLDKKKIAVIIGSHSKMDDKLSKAIHEFCEKYNAIVIAEHSSNYKGKYAINLGLLLSQKNFECMAKSADVGIYIGDISGAKYPINTNETWRVNLDGEIRDIYHNLTYVFEMEEFDFFKFYNQSRKGNINTIFQESLKEKSMVENLLPNLPFSNAWIAKQTSSRLPNNSELHLGILNSLRVWNLFDIPKDVLVYSNTGGFGIDGIMSTLIGASLVDKTKKYFCVLGDLAFFYDMNALGNRHLGKNIRILLVNNGNGTEFKLSYNPGFMFGNKTNNYISASGHYGNKSLALVKNYAENLGFEYHSAKTKEEYLEGMDWFLQDSITEKPLLLEVFTESEKENEAFNILQELVPASKSTAKDIARVFLSEMIGEDNLTKLRDKVKNKGNK